MPNFGIVGLMRFVNEQGLPIREVRAIYARAKRNANPCGLLVGSRTVENTLERTDLVSKYLHASKFDDPGYVVYKIDLAERERQ